ENLSLIRACQYQVMPCRPSDLLVHEPVLQLDGPRHANGLEAVAGPPVTKVHERSHLGRIKILTVCRAAKRQLHGSHAPEPARGNCATVKECASIPTREGQGNMMGVKVHCRRSSHLAN